MNNCSFGGGVGSTVLSSFAATIMNVGSSCVEFIL